MDALIALFFLPVATLIIGIGLGIAWAMRSVIKSRPPEKLP